MKVALLIEYHGAEFVGWQFQTGQRSVESELSLGVSTYLTAEAKKHGLQCTNSVSFSCSGRTDAGVHARGQVVSFRWPTVIPFEPSAFLSTLNGMLAKDLCVRAAKQVEETFDARKSPHRKCYQYYFQLRNFNSPLLFDRTWHVAQSLDVPKMQRAARLLEGTFDFRNFCSSASEAATTVRTLETSEVFWEGSEVLIYKAVGRGFLKNMVRIIAGYLVGIGRGVISEDEFKRLLVSETNFLPQHRGQRAPAVGLVLEWLEYDDPLDFIN